MVQAEGLDAVFECPSPDRVFAFIWLFDEIELSANNPPPGVVGIGTSTLTISTTGIAMNNGTVVRCRTVTGAGSFDSPNATLTIFRKFNNLARSPMSLV